MSTGGPFHNQEGAGFGWCPPFFISRHQNPIPAVTSQNKVFLPCCYPTKTGIRQANGTRILLLPHENRHSTGSPANCIQAVTCCYPTKTGIRQDLRLLVAGFQPAVTPRKQAFDRASPKGSLRDTCCYPTKTSIRQGMQHNCLVVFNDLSNRSGKSLSEHEWSRLQS